MDFLKQMFQKIGFREHISKCKDLPQPKSNRSHKVTTIIEAFIISVCCGANRFMHTEVTPHDIALGRMFDWKESSAQDTYKRFFSKFNQATNHNVNNHFYS